MNKRAVKAIAKKDISSITANVQIYLPMIIVPVIFCVVLPAALLLVARYTNINEVSNIGSLLSMLDNLPEGSLRTTLESFSDINQKILFLFSTISLHLCFCSFLLWEQVFYRLIALLEKKREEL